MTDVRRLTFLGLIALWGCAPAPVSPGSAQRVPSPATSKTDSPPAANVEPAAKTELGKTELGKTEPVETEPAKSNSTLTTVAVAAQIENKKGTSTAAANSEPFRFAESDSGQLLAALLIPERQPLPPLPIPNAPRPGRPMLLETLGLEPYRTPLEVSAAPKGMLPGGSQRPISVPGETPPMATASIPTLPAQVVIPNAPRLYAPSPVAAPPGVATAASSQVDPTAEAARGALLREPVAGRSTPAAPLPLEVANPFQASRDAGLRRPPAESPVAAEASRPRVNLPVPPAVK
jgi:hypothetical protein